MAAGHRRRRHRATRAQLLTGLLALALVAAGARARVGQAI
jgi:hypothetical protein